MKTDILDLRRMDCMEMMQTLEDGNVDLTVTSPPYGELRSYNGNNSLWSEDVWQKIIKVPIKNKPVFLRHVLYKGVNNY